MSEKSRRRQRSQVSRRDWHYIGDLLPDHTQCPGCDAWQAKDHADRSGWCPGCVDAGRQHGLFDIRGATGRSQRRNR